MKMSDWVSYEARLTEGYRRCAKLTWRYGTTYFWGAALLPKPQRKHVHAVYALCRLAVDLVDLRIGQHAIDTERDPTPTEPGTTPADQDSPVIEPALGHTPAEPGAVPTEPDPTVPDPVEPNASIAAQLEAFAAQFRTSLAAGDSTDPVMAAVVHTVITCGIDPDCFDRFFNAMAMDLTTTSYESWEDLRTYMEGSAAAIGEMMLPVLEPITHAATLPARSLGLAFQLTNFLRDIDEDLDRGRVYLPQDDLRLFDVNLARRAVTREWRAFLAYEIERNRALYSFADTGIAMLPPRSARCVGTARVLNAQILDQIERSGYDVFSHRARVPTWRKAATAARIVVTGPRTLKRQAEVNQRRSLIDVTEDTY
jgi:15-cis-phytoene synthase